MLVNVPKLITAYYIEAPDPSVPAQRVAFGTSGHRGSAFEKSFNERHILAISQAICLFRERKKIDGPLFLGMDTHALSVPALAGALEVLAANGVEVMLAQDDEYTPTPAVSHAILTYNRGRKTGLADGIVITPSHNPPHDGGFKYNPPNGGPAESGVTARIEAKANTFLEKDLRGIKRIPFEKALRAPTTHRHDYLHAYIADLDHVIEMEAIRGASVRDGRHHQDLRGELPRSRSSAAHSGGSADNRQRGFGRGAAEDGALGQGSFKGGHMISKILVPTDGSKAAQKAAKVAVDLAKQVNATVIALSVIDQRPFMPQTIPASGTLRHVTEPIESYLREAAESYVDEIRKQCGKFDVRSKIVIATGHPIEEILKEAERSKASLIIMGSHGRSALAATVLGSVTYGVIHRDTKIPVMVVKG